MALARYRQKRDFTRTPEPKGKPAKRRLKAPVFVIQKHAARRLHYDFRLEIGGTLKSWAVPQGFPLRRGERRLAVQVEDHPLEYGRFEGRIPEGNYGAGTVMLWDRGTYEVVGSEPLTALRAGKLHFHLTGKKLCGEWTLVRMKGREQGDKIPWLLIKSGEDAAPIPAKNRDRSVSSGRTMKQIAEGRSRIWESDSATPARPFRKTPRPTRVRAALPAGLSAVPAGALRAVQGLPRERAASVAPMQATLVPRRPRDQSGSSRSSGMGSAPSR